MSAIAPGQALINSVAAKFEGSLDFKQHAAYAGGNGAEALLCYLDSLVSTSQASELVLRPFTDPERFGGIHGASDAARLILRGGISCVIANLRADAESIAQDLLDGHCSIIFKAEAIAVTFEVRAQERRNVEAPKEEKVVKGAKDAFVETLRINIALVRRKMRHESIVIEKVTTNSACPTGVAMVYKRGFTSTGIVDEVRRRLERIDADAIISAAVIDQALCDRPGSIFPQLINTERADKFALNILEGRVGVLVDGLPMGWLAPGTFGQFFRVPEDEAQHTVVASILTLLRYGALILSLLLPAFYVAVAMYHQEMLPVKLMQAIITAKQSVPFPTAMETIAMLLAVELLQEAGLRLPNPVGETVSIIGALLVGQAAIDAKLVSPVVVIVVSLATIAGYTAPSQDMGSALRVCRMLLVLSAVAAGIVGVAAGLTMIIYYLCTIECLGVAYTTPFSTGNAKRVIKGFMRFRGDAGHRAETALHCRQEGEQR